jgi:hypothetical protein
MFAGPRVICDFIWPGGTDILIYQQQDHVAASFTVLNSPVEAIDRVVDALARSRGSRNRPETLCR